MAMSGHLSFALVCVFVSLFLGLTVVALQGYKAFTHEAFAAKITIEDMGDENFNATFAMPDGQTYTYKLTGDQFYVDAHILKWQPVANFFGIHTSYQLVRVAGRYQDITDEMNKPRSVHALSKDRELDLYHLRNKFSQLTFLVDAEYGSASFMNAKPGDYALMVSTSGLLIRKLSEP